ncbi:MAG: metal-sensing transcriptional repressor [Moraxellaceae bacterium]|nr:metal-sensing transcriptional repressor [Moraxellaceae bacterium]MCP5175999.1 metal-sensing transcriptional repressor [Moraxellaceae bacterium]
MNKPENKQQTELLKRLARVEGQIRGIQKMIQQPDADCEKVLQQMTAARRALDKAFFEMLACVIESNVLDEQQEAAQRMSEVKELLTRYA